MLAEIVAIVMVFSIPLVAILTSFYLKLQRLKLENQGDSKQIEQLKVQLGYLMAEQEELRERLRSLENEPRRLPEEQLRQERIPIAQQASKKP